MKRLTHFIKKKKSALENSKKIFITCSCINHLHFSLQYFIRIHAFKTSFSELGHLPHYLILFNRLETQIIFFISRIISCSEAVTRKCHLKKQPLKMSPNSQENSSYKVFLGKVEGCKTAVLLKKDSMQVFPSEILDLFQNNCSIEFL